jgi:branched-chain amino acid transport system ATP-binding protein
MSLFAVKDLTMKFGGLTAVSNFNLELGDNELVGLIGPNGAGKTTVFNMLTGIYRPTSGSIYLNKKSVIGLRPSFITELGLCRTFQNIRLFKDLSVIDNIKLAGHYRQQASLLSSILRTKKFKQEEQKLEDEAIELLKIFGLLEHRDDLAKNLSYGAQRKLEIARALNAKPKILLLDEPAAGMNPVETKELGDLIRFVREKFKITILLIEHDMGLVMKVCERITVLDYGQTIAVGTPSEIQSNKKVIEAYLGTDDE